MSTQHLIAAIAKLKADADGTSINNYPLKEAFEQKRRHFAEALALVQQTDEGAKP